MRCALDLPLASDGLSPPLSRHHHEHGYVEEGRTCTIWQQQPPMTRPTSPQLAASAGTRSSRSTTASSMSPTTSMDTSSTVRSDLTLTNDDPLDVIFPFGDFFSSDSPSEYGIGTAAGLSLTKHRETEVEGDTEELLDATAKEQAFQAVAASETVTTFSSPGDKDGAEISSQLEMSPQQRLHAPQIAAQSSFGSSKKVIIGNYKLGKTLGTGSIGKVKLATDLCTGEKLAVKIIPRSAMEGNLSQRSPSFEQHNKDVRVLREAAIMHLLEHPHVVSLREMISHPDHYYMFMEYVDGGHMLDYIVSRGILKERKARKIALQISSALDYLHRNSIVHRDLKIENILISKSGVVKITDFGLANLYSRRSLLSTFCGSLYFAAPELLNARVYTGPEVDVWSFGVVLHILVCGKLPFDDQTMPGLHAKIKRGIVEYPPWVSSECKDLLSRILVVNPLKRATMSEILSHPWMMSGLDCVFDTHVPLRQPLTLPLDPAVVCEITGFEFGDAEAIMAKLSEFVKSEEYQEYGMLQYKRQLAKLDKANAKVLAHADDIPPGLQHPLVSIYHLVREKRERRESQVLAEVSATTSSLGPKTSSHALPSKTGPTPPSPLARTQAYLAPSKSQMHLQGSAQPLTLPCGKTAPQVRPEFGYSLFPQRSQPLTMAAAFCEMQPSSSIKCTDSSLAVGSSTHPRPASAGKRGGIFRRISAALLKSLRSGAGHNDAALPNSVQIGWDDRTKTEKVLRRRTVTPFKNRRETADRDHDPQAEESIKLVGGAAAVAQTGDTLSMAFVDNRSPPSLPPEPQRRDSAMPAFWRTFSRRRYGEMFREFDVGGAEREQQPAV